MYPHVVYNSATPTGLGHVSTCYLQFCNPYRVGPGWFPIQRLMPSPNTTAYCLLPTAYGVGSCIHMSSTILQPLQGWVMYPHVVYNSATPTGLGHVSTCYLQFCNPYRVGPGWFPIQRLMPSPNTTAYCLLPTVYGVGLCIHMSSTILQPLQGWVMYPHVVYNSATPTGLGQVGFPSNA